MRLRVGPCWLARAMSMSTKAWGSTAVSRPDFTFTHRTSRISPSQVFPSYTSCLSFLVSSDLGHPSSLPNNQRSHLECDHPVVKTFSNLLNSYVAFLFLRGFFSALFESSRELAWPTQACHVQSAWAQQPNCLINATA